MKRLFFFMIVVFSMQYTFCADSSAQSAKKSPVLLTASQALNKWWNEDTGKVCDNFIQTKHQKQEAREDIFHCDISSCDRRDIRRMMLVIGVSCTIGAVAMPHLAVPIVSYGVISTSALALPLAVYKAPEDFKRKLD